MLEFIGNFLWIAIAGAASVGGYITTKRFVRTRLRFVDGVHRRGVPTVAGIAAGVAGGLVAAILPFVTTMTAVLFGIGIGTGVAAGRKDLKRLPSP